MKTDKSKQSHEAISDYILSFGSPEDETLLMDGFEEAFVGLVRPFNGPLTTVYDYRKMVEVLTDRDQMTDEEAEEYIEFNCQGAYVGKATPLILYPPNL